MLQENTIAYLSSNCRYSGWDRIYEARICEIEDKNIFILTTRGGDYEDAWQVTSYHESIQAAIKSFKAGLKGDLEEMRRKNPSLCPFCFEKVNGQRNCPACTNDIQELRVSVKVFMENGDKNLGLLYKNLSDQI